MGIFFCCEWKEMCACISFLCSEVLAAVDILYSEVIEYGNLCELNENKGITLVYSFFRSHLHQRKNVPFISVVKSTNLNTKSVLKF